MFGHGVLADSGYNWSGEFKTSGGPSLAAETYRRAVENDVVEMWYYLSSQLTDLKRQLEASSQSLKNEVDQFSVHSMVKRLTDVIHTGVDYKRSEYISVYLQLRIKTVHPFYISSRFDTDGLSTGRTYRPVKQESPADAKVTHDSAVIPRWPSDAILDFIEPQIAPFDHPTPKTVAQNQTLSGSDAPFARYSPLNYTVTLKLGFGVTQGHQKWHCLIEHIRLYVRLP